MNMKLVGIMAACTGLFVVACGDDTANGGAGGGGSSAGGNNTGAGTTDGGGGEGTGGMPEELTCQTGCEALFACGLEGTPPLCVYTAGDEDAFVPGCVETCADMMSLLAIIDPEDCPGTIMTIKTVSSAFEEVCDNGIPEGGGGAGGGSAGGGGAGGGT